ncbi:MAG: putative quinol monooxygenase [Actinomycetota bacterium]
MSRIVIVGAISVPAEQRTALLEEARPMIEAAREEEGCIEYSFLPDPFDGSIVRIVEEWRSNEDLIEHFTFPHTKAVGELIGRAGAERLQITKHLVTWSGSVSDDPGS